MEIPVTGPCEPWDADCLLVPEDPTPEQEELIEFAVQVATEILWMRTKKIFGYCNATFRPCHDKCGVGWPQFMMSGWQNATGWSWPFPALVGGQWLNIACGSCGKGCGCGHEADSIAMPFPLADVVEVRIDGEVLDPSAYVVYNRRDLTRVDGGSWPRCNDLGLPDTEPGTWSVTGRYGTPVPALGRRAVGQLATEIFRGCDGDGTGCLLPMATVRQITRQGVQKEFFNTTEAFGSGLIGLTWPDMFITTYNPTRTGVASIYNADGVQRNRVTAIGGP